LRKLGITLQVRSYEERSMGKGGDAKACAFMEVTQTGNDRECYGVGMDANIVTASIKALMSGVNRLSASGASVKAA
jgi:2-isopropylmalate synthase